MTRAPELVVAALAIAAAAAWVSALVTSLPPPAPVIVVQGERALPTGEALVGGKSGSVDGAPWALRFVAVTPGGTAPLDVTGTVTLNGVSANIEYNTARIDNAKPGRATFDVTVGGVGGAAGVGGVRAHGVVDVTSSARVDNRTSWRPWYGEVAMRNLARAPVYPVDGRVSARLPSKVVIVDDDDDDDDDDDVPAGKSRVRIEDVEPSVNGARLADGRVLQVDRSGLRLGVELQPLGDTISAYVEATEPRQVACDLIVDGFVRDAQNVRLVPKGPATPRMKEMDGTKSVQVPQGEQAQVSGATNSLILRMGTTRPDALVVVHCAGPYDGDVGRVALSRAAPTQQFATWVREIARGAGAPTHEPLLSLDDATLTQPEVAVAALARFAPSKVRAPKLDVVWTVDRGPFATLRTVYLALAALVVVATLALGVARMPQRRGAVVAGVVALAAVLGGLYAALVVIGS